MNPEYKKIFDSLKEEKTLDSVDSRVLLIDGLNTFLRAFAAIGWVNKDLSHIGGLTGFLRSLGFTQIIKVTVDLVELLLGIHLNHSKKSLTLLLNN